MKIFLTALQFALIFGLIASEDHEWRDPNDPTFLSENLKIDSKKSSVSSSELVPAVQKPDNSLRLIVRQLLQDLKIDSNSENTVQRNVKVKISRHSISALQKYLLNSDVVDLPEDREAVRSALSGIFDVIVDTPSDATWQDTYVFMQPFIGTLNILILPAALIVVVRSIVRPKNFWILVFSTVLMISMYSGYNRKYQEAESRRFAQFQENSRDACAPEGLLSRMVEIVASPFQYRQKSKCLKYIESQTISIFHEISIIEVFSETISGGFFAFMSSAAKHINLFFKDLFDGAPILAQIVMTFFIILMSGAVRTPFFSYEPIWLTFCSTSIGKIAGWLEGGEPEPSALPPQNSIYLKLPKKEVKRIESGKPKKIEKSIDYPKSEKEDEKSGEKSGRGRKRDAEKKRNDDIVIRESVKASEEDPMGLEGASDDEDVERDSETEWNEAINSSSLSESSQ